MSMEAADYYMLNPDKTRAKDSKGNDILVRYGAAEGTFDLNYDENAKEIVATVRVLMVPKDIVELDPVTKAEKVDASGNKVSVPYDHDVHAVNSPRPNLDNKIVPRASSGMDLQVLAKKIAGTLNQDKYKLTIDGCAQGGACNCQIAVRFAVELQDSQSKLSRPAHRTVNLYPRASRADSGSWGEVNVYEFTDPSGLKSWTPVTRSAPHLVSTHEIGHLFSWPDEYWKLGGACHKQYINGQDIDFTTEAPLVGADTWQLYSAGDLMGGGTMLPAVVTPPYYIFRIRDWFKKRTGKSWKVIK